MSLQGLRGVALLVVVATGAASGEPRVPSAEERYRRAPSLFAGGDARGARPPT